ncbi:hypothetical protein [Nostoc sp.]|uniref:hypothetical protein n=1 Tax=Nostoc sp. TaxID=1180 RepID=UPI002FFC20F0
MFSLTNELKPQSAERRCGFPSSLATPWQIRLQTRSLGLYKKSPQRRAEILKVHTLEDVGVESDVFIYTAIFK